AEAAMTIRREAEGDQARQELDDLVINMELTLISIIQGIALYFLFDHSRTILGSLDLVHWPYLFTSLLFILSFWSRALIHTFTVIRWPLDFGHNFLYIVATLLMSVMASEIDDPIRWFALGIPYAASLWLLFVFDQRLLKLRLEESETPKSREL